MQYIFTVLQSEYFSKGIFDSNDEAFTKAVKCACTAVLSILTDENVSVECEPPKIIISSGPHPMPFSLAECEERIQGAFLDNYGNLYPEFSGVSTASN